MKYRFIFLILIMILAGCTTHPQDDHQVTVSIYKDHHQKKVIEKKLPLNDTNVLDLMIHNFNVRTLYHGEVFAAINGIETNEKQKMGWFYTVNGKEPTAIPHEIKLKPGDHIEFDYHHYFSPK